MEETKEQTYKSDLYLLHGEYVRMSKEDDAYIAFFKNIKTNKLEMKIYDSPQCKLWITKPEYRNYTQKKEWSPANELDEYSCRFKDRAETIWKALNFEPGKRLWTPRYIDLRQQLSNPYVYGADLDMGARIKSHFDQINGHRIPLDFHVGYMDIETDVNGSNQIILITYVDDSGDVYTGILQEFFGNHTLDEVQKMFDEEVEPQFHNSLNNKVKPIYEKIPPLKLHLKILPTELDVIKWVFDRVHENRPDFVTFWNMDFDMPYILERLAYRQVDPCDVLCSPEIPKKYRICKYHVDKPKPGDHIVDTWSWFHLTDYTQYVDAMRMYGRLRKAKPKEAKYSLEFIGTKEIGSGKLEFGESEDHHTMQREHQVRYTVYNIIDVAILRYMEAKNHDARSMVQLIGDAMLEDFSKQSIQLRDMFTGYLVPEGGHVGAMSLPITSPWDKYITNTGGQVLSPDRTHGSGVPILLDAMIESLLHKLVCDIDVSLTYIGDL